MKDPEEIKREIERLLAQPTCTVDQFRKNIIRSSKNAAYEAIRRGEIEVIRVAGRIHVVVAPWRKRLGYEGQPSK